MADVSGVSRTGPARYERRVVRLTSGIVGWDQCVDSKRKESGRGILLEAIDDPLLGSDSIEVGTCRHHCYRYV